MDLTSAARIAFNRLRYGRGIAPPHEPAPEQLAFFAQLVGEGSLVFDVGSNVGDKAAAFLALGARVVAFEPQPSCARILRRRFRGNSGIEVVEAGVADSSGELTLNVCPSARTISTFSKDWQDGRFSDFTWDEKIVVPVLTLDEAIARFGRPDFTKIDVEGFEESVLQGLSEPVGTVSFEFAREFADKLARCLDSTSRIGYGAFNLGLGEDSEFVFDEWVSAGEILGFVEGSDDELLWGDVYARQSSRNAGVESPTE